MKQLILNDNGINVANVNALEKELSQIAIAAVFACYRKYWLKGIK